MLNADVVCPLYCADKYIDGLIAGIKSQVGIRLVNVVFPLTEEGDTRLVKEKIESAGFKYFSVEPENFSHSLTRERAVFDYCQSDIVIMLSQDVNVCNADAFCELASAISERVIYAYGRQVCRKKTIEYYVREKNYGESSQIVSSEDVESLQLKAFFASDAFSAYYRPAFLDLNGYDGAHMMMSEDMYYAKKALDAGYCKGYVASAVVEHSHKLTLKQLYARYFETGKWFAEHPEFDGYKTTDTGLKLALYVLGRAICTFNIPVIFRWLPDMTARYLGMKKGKKVVRLRGR